MPPRTRRALLLVAALATLAAGVWALAWGPGAAGPVAERATWVGADRCATCHADESGAWQGSQHQRAMQPATAGTVLGDFDDATYSDGTVTTTFSRRGDEYFVRTDGADGDMHEFRVAYTFGVEPLQQYLIPFDDGRLQALSIAWDSRPADAGGQRWFHLYPGERIDHTDELHWTGRMQNWNFMCADCHSTGLRKGYDADSNRFATTWAEIDVACEACHGPGSEHVRWAEASVLRDWRWPGEGLATSLTERRDVSWITDPTTGVPARSVPRTTDHEIEVCAACHSRRAQIAEGPRASDAFFDDYVPALLETGLYFPDGQKRDEVYTYGSFLQSRMYHAGVTCADCHDPHTGKTRATGNALCTTCHASARYDTTTHHFHQAGSTGSSCVDCHMPTRTYMGVDVRRDHSFRVPRPDLSVSMGVPNACTACHDDRDDAWAAAAVRQWYGRDARGFQQFADAFQADDTSSPDAPDRLGAVAADATQSAIARASALERLATRQAPEGLAPARAGLRDPSPLVRRAALAALVALPPANRIPMAAPLLDDVARAVRLEAVWQLAPAAAGLGGDDRAAFDRAAAEYVAALQLQADRPEARSTLAAYYAQVGRPDDAEREYRSAIALAPTFVPAYVNLAELLRTNGGETAAEGVLRQGLERNPDAAELHYALGLSFARSRRLDDAINELERAATLAPASARFAYAYAVALHSAGRVSEALDVVAAANARFPADRDLLIATATFNRDAGHLDAAIAAARRLRDLDPADRDARALVSSLEAAGDR